ncbi:peptidylprolyl isomerase [Oceanisphaera arctica]|uniref:Peptidyl-prolyl cis-trans isomerase n=1 Tax=Oceanisphaera arctica TaxID=641510 RepID=A0A2P5TLC6_9GAMM|nr:peptidylprolyl isomerase [Oceanisphaera arctica]PPL16076.1 peptidylprolyl isomerase [Oceanisphaera arctica]GHA26539.1 peptidyl-prolyl cis-trans isomerase [Oceanisphaera arctica]
MKRFILLAAGLLMAGSALAGPRVELVTNLGTLEVELNDTAAPASVANFLRYVDDGSYNNSIFHRLIPGFVVQGGGFNTDHESLPTYAPVINESGNGLSNLTGTIAMARTQDPDSATRQFYINLSDNHSLDGGRKAGYTVFGKVINGEQVLQKMAQVPTGMNLKLRARDVPEQDIILQQVRRLDDAGAAH